ncbi:MAG: archease [Candidatus Heimdallarchaeota archaeon]|nr:archease [Candidatus Heimdallarchaeota archaeon]
MFRYNILTEEVKSDFAFEVFSDSISGLFRGAGIAMMLAMVDTKELVADKKWEFKLKSENLNLLLFDFLGELVYLKDVESILFKDFEIKIEEENEMSLNCVAHGTEIDYSKNEILTDVKAITMHKFVLEKREDEWYCHVIVDL